MFFLFIFLMFCVVLLVLLFFTHLDRSNFTFQTHSKCVGMNVYMHGDKESVSVELLCVPQAENYYTRCKNKNV